MKSTLLDTAEIAKAVTVNTEEGGNLLVKRENDETIFWFGRGN